jgi:hypothetical protein
MLHLVTAQHHPHFAPFLFLPPLTNFISISLFLYHNPLPQSPI